MTTATGSFAPSTTVSRSAMPGCRPRLGGPLAVGRAGAGMRIDVRLPAVASSAVRARHSVIELCESQGVDSAFVADVALAVTEAVTNVIRHAYPDREGDVEVWAEIDRGGLVVIVRDFGVGPDVPSSSPGMGVGLHVMHRLADDFAVGPGHPGTRVRLQFGLDSRSTNAPLAPPSPDRE